MKKEISIFKSIVELQHMTHIVFYKEFIDSYEIPHDMNHTHIKTLHYLKYRGTSPMHIISSRIGIERGSFTPVAKKLIQLGYVNKVRDDDDKRIFNLELTEQGRVFTDKFHIEHSKFVEGKIEALTHSEKELFLSSMDMLMVLTKKCE